MRGDGLTDFLPRRLLGHSGRPFAAGFTTGAWTKAATVLFQGIQLVRVYPSTLLMGVPILNIIVTV
jgi:hypothetical protein